MDHLSKTNQDENHEPLPEGWERCVTPQNRVYYIDHNTRTTSWTKPSSSPSKHISSNKETKDQISDQPIEERSTDGNGSLLSNGSRKDDLEPLPSSWEARTDNVGRTYFINHESRRSQWEDPRLLSKEIKDHAPETPSYDSELSNAGKKEFEENSFNIKVSELRDLCLSTAETGSVKIEIRRQFLLADSMDEIMRLEPIELRKRLVIRFRNEEALDYGGVSKEWFYKVSIYLRNPNYGMFEYASGSSYSLQISPLSASDADHLKFFRFAGRFIALALYGEQLVDCIFTIPFFKQLLDRKLTIYDLQSMDPEYFKSLKLIEEADEKQLDDMELYFEDHYEILGEACSHELKPGGKDIKVDISNSSEYIGLLVAWRFSRGVEQQNSAFKEGFQDIFPAQWLNKFEEKELQLLLRGTTKIDVDDWQEHTVYKQYTKTSPQIEWFWKWLKSRSEEGRNRFLEFVTGSGLLPVGGFKDLKGKNGPQEFCIEKAGTEIDLPRSHTCFNRLDLPPYTSYEKLCEKMNLAVDETEGFGQE